VSVNDSPPGPVPRVRREEVRRRLLEAAATVFAKRGYAGARLDEIAHTAGFTKGAVYSNFSGKHALLAELIEQHLRTQFSLSVEEIRSQDRPDRIIEDIADVYARSIVEDGTWTRLLVEIGQQAGHDAEVRQVYVGVRRALRDQLAERLEQACATLGYELVVPAEQVALTLQALRMGLSVEHGTDPEQVDAEHIARVFAATLRGLVKR
jgi:AcrR family transcriptional regulator